MSSPFVVQAPRTYPVPVEKAFDRLLTWPLEELFDQRYGPLPPVRDVQDQVGTWGTVGQTRTIRLADGGTMREELTVVDRARSFGYEITEVSGPMKPLVAAVGGEWRFDPAGTGVRITWTWTVQPASTLAGYAMPVFARFWQGYARLTLARVEGLLVAA